jgi:integrase
MHAIQSAKGHMPLIIQVAAMLGLRRAEIAALTWGDIVGDRLVINKSFAKTSDNEWVIKSPKSYSGTRSLSVPPALLSAILASRPLSASNADQIFPVNPDYITKHWYLLCQECGFHCRFHDLRHYNASIMLSLGVPDKYAMARMGHATTNMLKQVYQHIIDDRERQESAKVDAYMAKFSQMQHEMQHEKPARRPAFLLLVHFQLMLDHRFLFDHHLVLKIPDGRHACRDFRARSSGLIDHGHDLFV